MNYIILDLEWNQCPTGKEKENSKIPFEIIEIGAVKLGHELNVLDTFSETICPKVYKHLHFKIRELSMIRMEDLKSSDDFQTVIHQFLDWCGKDYQFCTWGSMDLIELQRNMQFYRVKKRIASPLIYLDIQKLFGLHMNYERNKACGLSTAAEKLQIPISRPFHRALSDCLYTYDVMKTIQFNRLNAFFSIDCYYAPRNKAEQIYAKFPTYHKFVSRKFLTKERALMDPEITKIVCTECEQEIEMHIPWFSDNARIYYALGYCTEHGYVMHKLKMKKNVNNEVYVVKIMKPTTMEEATFIGERQDVLRMKRKEKRIRSMKNHEGRGGDKK